MRQAAAKRMARWSAASVCAISVTACGGGDGGTNQPIGMPTPTPTPMTTPTPTPTPTPTASIMTDKAPVQINPGSTEARGLKPATATLSDGGFVVASINSARTPQALVYTGSGVLRVTVTASNATLSNQDTLSVTGLDTGGFVLAWADAGTVAGGRGIRSQAFDLAGNPIGVSFFRANPTERTSSGAMVSDLPGNGYAVAWTQSGPAALGMATPAKPMIQIVSDMGAPKSDALDITDALPGRGLLGVVTLNAGNLAIFYTLAGTDPTLGDIRFQIRDASGAILKADTNTGLGSVAVGTNEPVAAVGRIANGGFAVVGRVPAASGNSSALKTFAADGSQATTVALPDVPVMPILASDGAGNLILAGASPGSFPSIVRISLFDRNLQSVDARTNACFADNPPSLGLTFIAVGRAVLACTANSVNPSVFQFLSVTRSS